MKSIHLRFGAFVDLVERRENGRKLSAATVRTTAPAAALGTDDVDALVGLAKYYESASRELMKAARDAALEAEEAGSGRVFNGFDDDGRQQWVESTNWLTGRDHGGKRYHRTGKIGRLRVKSRTLGGSIGEPIAEYESSDKNRILVNLDGEVVAENA